MFSCKVFLTRLAVILPSALVALVLGNAAYFFLNSLGPLPCNDCHTNALWLFNATTPLIETLKAATLGIVILIGALSGMALLIGGPLYLLGASVKPRCASGN